MRILMCRPTYFDIEYEINPWMHEERNVDKVRALDQWEKLYATYVDLGQNVLLTDPVPGLPDFVFTANGAVVWKGNAVLSHFHDAERQSEEPHWRKVFNDLGMTLVDVPKGITFEGAGDALFVGDHLFCGYGFRTERAAVDVVAELLDVHVTPLQLVDPHFYHLDTCFVGLDDSTVMLVPSAFTAESLSAIRERVPTVIDVPPDIAAGFACNATPIGRHIVASEAIVGMQRPLADAGFDIYPLAMSEFMKSGGAARCLSLPLDLG